MQISPLCRFWVTRNRNHDCNVDKRDRTSQWGSCMQVTVESLSLANVCGVPKCNSHVISNILILIFEILVSFPVSFPSRSLFLGFSRCSSYLHLSAYRINLVHSLYFCLEICRFQMASSIKSQPQHISLSIYI